MTYVVTETCIKCKYTDCVEVCPVDCFHEGPNFLVIDPEECIDCTLCVPECPVNAIYAEDDVPPDQSGFLALNAELSKKWPTLTEKKPAPDDAKQWEEVKDKSNTLSAERIVRVEYGETPAGVGRSARSGVRRLRFKPPRCLII